MTQQLSKKFVPLSIAVLTVSDTRDESTDKSGKQLVSLLQDAGHILAHKEIVKDDIYAIRASVSNWIFDTKVNVIITTGGTGFAGRDSTPEAVSVLFDKNIDGFGELFRQLSYQEISTSTIQSRVLGGIANKTLIFSLPGSTNACLTGWNKIIKDQIDSTNKPCNFVAHILE
ncbi:MAG: molybdenum cofactor biosynthesis protein B [Gammaproteobacteria bacterium]|nr:molybdenum cofactor biosynthesis protein B [Gammaproteobacteria bacterium]